MSEARVAVERAEPQGMVTLRGDNAALARALSLFDLAVPPVRRMLRGPQGAVLWMSPDEVLLLLAPDQVAAALARIDAALAGVHHLAVDVSDARVAFTLTGRRARETLAKLCPVDFAPGAFADGDVRRTRAAQVAAAVWCDGEVFTLVCFRSVAGYVEDLLRLSSAPGGEVNLFQA